MRSKCPRRPFELAQEEQWCASRFALKSVRCSRASGSGSLRAHVLSRGAPMFRRVAPVPRRRSLMRPVCTGVPSANYLDAVPCASEAALQLAPKDRPKNFRHRSPMEVALSPPGVCRADLTPENSSRFRFASCFYF
eukprot:Amastigsp_a193778_14.p2 type:complete len:136 gc:universal Amastigsp_a193778_14:94-501(+)